MPALSPLRRRLCRVSLLVFLGDSTRLRREVASSLRDGVPAETVREAILQNYLFAGFPRCINALGVLADLAPLPSRAPVRRDLASWQTRGELLCRRVYGRTYDKMISTMRRLHPDLADWILWEGYGKVLSRPLLDAATRELCVIPVLAAAGTIPQLRSHLVGARNCGATAAEVREALSMGLRALPAKEAATARRLIGGAAC